MTRILSLDISSVSTGYAIFDNDQLIHYGIIDTSKIKKHSERLFNFEIQLKDIIEKWDPEVIAAEDIYKGRNPKTHKILALYHGITYKLCFQYLESDPSVLYAGEIRSIVGNAYNAILKKKGVKDKELTFAFIKDKYSFSSFEFKKHNDITDAIAIGLAIANILGTPDFEEYIGCARSQKKRRRKKASK